MKMGQRISKPAHSVRIALLVPHSRFTPTPTMSPLKVAYYKGLEAKRLGRAEDENPHTDKLAPNNGALSAEWLKGFGK